MKFVPLMRSTKLTCAVQWMVRSSLLCLLCGTASCVSVKTEHRIEPIHITMDVNVRLERELNDAFADLDARSLEIAEEKGAQ